MKRYNKQLIMKDAHKLYNNKFHRKGRSWGECLKAAWSWEKDAVRVREEKAEKLSAIIAASWAVHNTRKQETKKDNFFSRLSPEEISYSMGYGRGNGSYCGD